MLRTEMLSSRILPHHLCVYEAGTSHANMFSSPARHITQLCHAPLRPCCIHARKVPFIRHCLDAQGLAYFA